MRADQLLDLSGIVIPFSLVLCKGALTQMAPGKVLEIHLRDHETLQSLLVIVERSGDHVLAWERRQDDCVLWVQKSAGSSPSPLN